MWFDSLALSKTVDTAKWTKKDVKMFFDSLVSNTVDIAISKQRDTKTVW